MISLDVTTSGSAIESSPNICSLSDPLGK